MNQSLRNNIPKFYLYKAFNRTLFFAPIFVLFLQSKGLSMSEVFTLQTIYAFSVVLLEVPSGAFADKYGKKLSLVLGSMCYALSMFMFVIGDNFGHFALVQLISALGMSLISGADSAFLYETLKSLQKEQEYKKIQGKASGLTQILGALGSIVGGIAGSISFVYSFLLTGFVVTFATILAITFKKPIAHSLTNKQPNYKEIIISSFTIVKNNRQVLWLLLYFAFLNGFLSLSSFFLQPYLKLIGIPIAVMGVFYAIDSIISGLGSIGTDYFEKITKHNSFLIITVVISSTFFLLGTFPSLLILPLWFLLGIFMLINEIVTSEKVLSIVEDNKAATVLSFQNLARRFTYGVFGPLLGLVSDKFGVPFTFQIIGIFLLIVLSSLLLLRNKHFALPAN